MGGETAATHKKLDDMSVTRFLDCVCEENDANQRFCFILGSGASYTSGIRTGVELMKHWRGELDAKGTDYIKECAKAANYEWESCKHIFEEPVEKLKNEDYFTLYDIRFVGCPTAGYAALEDEMEGHAPNVGYYYLASILANTQNRLVITTNFDSLTEDALFYYSGHHPLVLGHEKLASYVASVDRKPVVAKIHRDLLMDPMNHMEQMQRLQEEWSGPLSAALSRYIPIVIGYAGGDRTLMSLLEKLQLKGIFWCTLEKAGEAGFPEKAREIVKKNHGHWVKIKGFDELMYRMATAMEKMPKPDMMHEAMDKRYEAFKSRHEDLTKEYSPSRMKQSSPETADEDAGMIQAVLQEEISRDPDLEEYNRLLSRALSLMRKEDNAEAIKLCDQAIALQPTTATGYDYRSTVYHRMQEYALALEDAEKALEYDPENASYYHSRGVTLYEMGRYEEALKDDNKAIEYEPENARYYHSRAVTLHALKRYEEAMQDRDKAVAYDPENAHFYNQRGVTLHAMGRYEEALCDKNKAIEYAPDKADYYNSRAITLHTMGNYEDALQDRDQAIRCDPINANYYYGRSVTLHEMGRYEESLRDNDIAITWEPENASYYYGRSVTLRKMGRYEEALKDRNKAIEYDPENARYYNGRSITLHEMGRYEEALADSNKAIALSPEDAVLYDSRGTTLQSMERYEEALADMDKAVELEPRNAEFWRDRSEVLEKLERHEEAEQSLAKAEALDKQQE